MRKLILTIIIISGFINLFSQKIDLDMNSYKTPDLFQHSLQINLDSRFNIREYNMTTTYADSLEMDNHEQFENYSNNNNSAGIDLFYNMEVDLQKRYHYLNIYPSFDYRNYSSNSDSNIDLYDSFKRKQNYDNDISRLYNNVGLDSRNKFYLENKPLFLAADFLSNLFYYKTDDSRLSEYYNPDSIDDYSRDQKKKKYVLDSRIALGYGKIHTTKYLRIAISIFQELQDNNLLKKQPTNEEITKFADFLIEVNNKKFFISSDKKKYQIEQIVKFFLDRNLINKAEHHFFSILYDNWFNNYFFKYHFAYPHHFTIFNYNTYYRTNPTSFRGSGQLIEIGIGYSSNYSKTVDNATYNHTIYQDTILVENSSYNRVGKEIKTSPYIFIKAEKHRSHGLDFQSNFFSLISYDAYSGESEDTRECFESEGIPDSTYFSQLENSNQLLVETNYALSWFLSKNSVFRISNSTYYLNLIGEEKKTDQENYQEFAQHIIGSSTTLNGSYYISPQVKLSTSASLIYQKEIYGEETLDRDYSTSYLDFYFRIEYYIF